MIVETHIHLCDKVYDADRKKVLERAKTENVLKIINTGADMEEDRQIVSEDYGPEVYRAIGFHPHGADTFTPAVFDELKAMVTKTPRVVAVGEIGLDYFNNPVPKEAQFEAFTRLLGLAQECFLPAAIHVRDAYADALVILKENPPDKRGVIHCFTQGPDVAKHFLDLGYMLGVGGVVTFKNALPLKETVKAVGLEHLLLETDAPYLAPGKHRGKRNEPAFLRYIVEEIAALKGCTTQEVEEATTRNAEKLFGI